MTVQNERIAGTTVLAAPNAPMKVARQLATQYPGDLAWWRDGYYTHAGSHWIEEDKSKVVGWLYQATEDATYVSKDKEGNDKSAEWNPDRTKIGHVEHALSRSVIRRDGEAVTGYFLRNGALEMDEAGQRVLLPHSPLRFNLTSLPFDYDPAAHCPEWLAFLDSSLPGDTTAHAFLQEWFGYVLSGRTDHQMMAVLVGASRSGKGTIVRVLEAMLGHGNSTGVTLGDLAGEYGLSGLIGKSLATISEPKWASKEANQVVEPLLRITGNDQVRANRKYKDEWVGYLGTRIMILSNETPRLINRSGALANRMINVRFSVSFAGREDIGLEDRLMTELPGILNWSIEGQERLDAQGSFTKPESHKAVSEKMREYADPDADFLESHARMGSGYSSTENEVFEAYKEWMEAGGRTQDHTNAMTLRHRLTERPGITAKRVGKPARWVIYGLTVDEWTPNRPRPDDDDFYDNTI